MKKMRSLFRREGSAFIIVMMLTGILIIAGVSLTYLTSHAAFAARKIQDGASAMAIAEAGIAECLYRMSTNGGYSYWQGKSFSNNYSDGSFSVSTVLDSNSWNTIITSVGIVNRDQRTTIMETLGSIFDRWNATVGVDGCIVAGGNVTLNTSALTINGDVHCNGSILNTTGNPDINGSVSACGSIAVDASGSETPNADPITVPNYLPFDDWKTLAISNGLYYSNSLVAGGYDFRPSNGVVYVEGDVEIANQSSLIGTLVASGTITVNNRFTHTSFNTNWPALLAGVDINEFNLNNYYGVMFAGNNVTLRNQRNCIGAIIALNNVSIENATTLDPLGRYPWWGPYSEDSASSDIVLGGWLQ